MHKIEILHHVQDDTVVSILGFYTVIFHFEICILNLKYEQNK